MFYQYQEQRLGTEVHSALTLLVFEVKCPLADLDEASPWETCPPTCGPDPTHKTKVKNFFFPLILAARLPPSRDKLVYSKSVLLVNKRSSIDSWLHNTTVVNCFSFRLLQFV